MKTIVPPDKHHVLAAEGWLDLGNEVEALKELEKLAPELSAHPEVLKLRLRVYGRTKNWVTALGLAQLITHPGPHPTTQALCEGEENPSEARTSALRRFVPAGGIRFPFLFAIPYNLACYACQLGHLKEAWEWFRVAIEMADRDEIRKLALNDSDLEPLWGQISQI